MDESIFPPWSWSAALFGVTCWYWRRRRQQQQEQQQRQSKFRSSQERYTEVSTDRWSGQVGPRGKAALAPPIPYLGNFVAALNDQCHEESNPRGYIPLCVAENKLVLDLISQRFLQSGGTGFADSTVYTYNSFLGLPVAREAAAYFLARRFLSLENDDPVERALQHIRPNHIGFGAGCAALINHLFFLLGQPGDCCLIPAPYYAAFENDMQLIAEIAPWAVPQAHPAAGPTVQELQTAHHAATRAGYLPKFLLLTNPNNPLGTIYTPEVLKRVVHWARTNHMHIICDEIYALTTHEDQTFNSIIQVLDNQLGNDVHVLWAVSKDFAASGLRCGLVYTQNEILMEGLATVSIFTCVSGPIQYLVAEILTDDVFCDFFLRESRSRIQASYQLCIAKLNEMVLPFVPAQAGLFVYVDFSSLLPEKTFQHEAILSEWMFQYARIVLTPGQSQRESRPGMFRICYAWVSRPVLEIAMERLSRFVAKVRRLPREFWDHNHTTNNNNKTSAAAAGDPDLARAFAGVLSLE